MEDFVCASCNIQADGDAVGAPVESHSDEIVLYTTHCPKCEVLKAKLTQKGVKFSEVDNVDEMIALGFEAAPVLGVHGEFLQFADAVKWVNGYKE
jgi:hypothetical protein